MRHNVDASLGWYNVSSGGRGAHTGASGGSSGVLLSAPPGRLERKYGKKEKLCQQVRMRIQ